MSNLISNLDVLAIFNFILIAVVVGVPCIFSLVAFGATCYHTYHRDKPKIKHHADLEEKKKCIGKMWY